MEELTLEYKLGCVAGRYHVVHKVQHPGTKGWYERQEDAVLDDIILRYSLPCPSSMSQPDGEMEEKLMKVSPTLKKERISFPVLVTRDGDCKCVYAFRADPDWRDGWATLPEAAVYNYLVSTLYEKEVRTSFYLPYKAGVLSQLKRELEEQLGFELSEG